MELGGEDVYMVAHQMQVQHEMYMDAHESEARGAGGRRATAAVVVPARSRRQPAAPVTAVTAPKAQQDGTAKRSKKKKHNLFGTRPYLVHCRIPEDLVWGPTGLRRGSCSTSEEDDDDEEDLSATEGDKSKELNKVETANDIALMDTSSIAHTSIPDLVLTSTMAAFTLSQRADPEKEMSSTQGPTDMTKSTKKKKKHRLEKESNQRSHDDLVPEGPEDRITVDHVRQMMACFYSTNVDVTTLLEEEVQSLKARSKFEGIKGESGKPFKEEVVGKGGSVWRMDAAASTSHNKIRRSVMATAQAQLESHESFLKTHKESEMRSSSFIIKKGDAQRTLPNSRKSFDGENSRPSRDACYQAELNRALSAVQKARKSSRKGSESEGAGGTSEAGETANKKTDQATDDEEMFARLSLRKRRRLDVANFISELSKVIGHLASEDELRGWFNRADVDNTGTVGWDELSAFLLSKGDHRGHMETRPFSLGIQLQPETCHPWNRHEGRITCAASSPKTGRVYTGGEEGMIIAWDENTLRHHGVLYRGTSWIVGLKLSHNYGRLFACTSNRELLIFDLKSGYLVRQYNGRTVFAGEVGASYASESTPMITVGGTKAGHLAAKGERVCTNRADETEKLRRLMAQKGAKGGGVSLMGGLDLTSGRSIAVGASGEKMHADELKRLTEVASDHTKGTDKRRVEQFLLVGLIDIPTSFEYHHSAHGNDIVFFGTRQGQILLYVIPATHEKFVKPLVTLGNVHTAQINDIQILPELECALSCSDDCTLKLISMETGAVTRTYRGHKTGVLGFVFAHKTKLIVSHSSERSALVWDYYQDTPIFALQEHASPLISICVNEREGHVYTLSNDNAIRISDIVSHKTLQTVQHKRVLPTSAMQASDGAAEIPSFCTMMYDSVRRRHLCCSSFPQMYQLKKAATQFPPSYTGHISPVATLKYNSAFKQLITFDLGLTVIWDPITGSSRFSFPYATNFSSTSSSGAGDGALLDEVRITAVGWDVTQRRLLVGFHNGMMVAWNYANGQALNVVRDSTFDYVHAAATYGTEVTAIAATVMADKATYVYAVGRCLMFVPESQQYTISTTTKWELPDELGGITSLARISSSLFAIGTTSGAVVFYNVSMEQMEGRPLWLSEQAITHGVLLSSQDEPPSPKKDEPASSSLCGTSLNDKMTRRGSRLGVSVGGRSRATSRTAFVNIDQSNSGSLRRTSSAAPTNASNPSSNSNTITSTTNRVEKVFHLGAKGNALLTAHNDGHCGLWHTTKRSFLGGFYVTGGAPVPEEGSKSRVSVGISNFAIEEEKCETFAYSDELGNVSVWSLAFEEIPFVDCLKRYLKTNTTTGATNALDWHMGSKESVTALSETHTKRLTCFKAHDAGTITGVVLLPALDGGGGSGPVSAFSYSGKGPIIITCSSDCTTKAFTLEGVCMGVFGLKPWSLHKANTWVTSSVEPPVEAPAQAGVDLDDTGGQFGPGGNLPSGITFASMMGKLSGSRRRVGAEAGDPDMVDVLIAQESFGINTAEVKRKRAERLKVKEARKKEILRRRRAKGRTGGGRVEDGGDDSDNHLGSQSNRSAEEAQALLETLNRIPHVPVFAPQSIRIHQPITYLAPAGSVLDEQLQPAHDMPSQQRQRKVFQQYEQRRRVSEARKKRELRAQQRAEDELLDRSGGSRCASNMSSRQSMSSIGSRPNSSHSQHGSPLHVAISSSDSDLEGGLDEIEDTAALVGHGDNYHDRRGLERGGLFRPLRPPNDPRSFPVPSTRNTHGVTTATSGAPLDGPPKGSDTVDATSKRPSTNPHDDPQDDEGTPAAYPIDIHGAYDPVAARRRAILKKSALSQHQDGFDDDVDEMRETSHVAEFAFLGASENDVKAVSPRGGSSCRPGYSSIRASPNPVHITPIGDPYTGMAYLEAQPQRGMVTGPSVSLSADRYSPQASPSPNRGSEAPPTARSPRLRPLRKRAGPTSPITAGLVPTIEISASFNTAKGSSSLNGARPSPRTWSALSGVSMAVTEDDGMGSRQPSTSVHASTSPPQHQSFPELLSSFLGAEGGGEEGIRSSHSSSWTNPVIKIAPTVPVPPPAQSTLLTVDAKTGAVMRRISAVSFKSPSPMTRSRMTTPHQTVDDAPVAAVEPSPVEVAPNVPGSGVDAALQQRLVSFGTFALDGSPPPQHASPPTIQQPLPKIVRSPRTSPKNDVLTTSPSAGSIDLPPIAIPQSAVEVPLSPRGTNHVPPTPHKTDITLRAVEHLREQQDRLEQYGMAGRMRAVEQQLQHRAATSNAAQRATDGHKAEVSAVQGHLQRLMGEGGATAAEANRRNAVNDAFQSVQRLSSQLIVTPVPPPRPPEGSWAAQEEARRSAASSGARRIGARGGNYDESAGPSVTAPGVRSGGRTARF